MNQPAPPGVALPDAVVLLAHHPTGGALVANVAKEVGAAAAEVGELARLNLLTIDGDRLRVLAPGPTGVRWADLVLFSLARNRKPLKVRTWLIRRGRDGVFPEHRQALVDSGAITVQQRRWLGLVRYHSYVPDAGAQAAVLGSLRQVLWQQRPIDAWTAQLAAVMHASGLGARLLHDKRERRALKHIARGDVLAAELGQVVAATNAALTTSLAAAAAAGGGDGGGGDGGGG